MTRAPKVIPPSLEQLKLELFILANGIGDNPADYALRRALQGVITAYEKEASQAFALGILLGAGGLLFALLAFGAGGYQS